MQSLVRLTVLLSFVTTALAVNHVPVIVDPPSNGVARAIPVGKTLIFPITVSDQDSDPLTFKVTSNNPRIIARVKSGEPTLRLKVSYLGNQSGDLVFALFREWAPNTVGMIGGFAQAGFYDNLKFHRVVKDFMIQGGDPLGTGSGGPGMTGGNAATAFHYDNEFRPGLIFTGRGQLAMANAGYAGDYSGSNGSQFFVTFGQPRFLDFKHTIFGQLLRGWSTFDAIGVVPTHNNSANPPEQSVPDQDVVITEASIEANDHDAVLMLSATGSVPSPGAKITVTANDGHGGVATKVIEVSAVADTANSPPVVAAPGPMTVPKETELDFPLRNFDLEWDYVRISHGVLSGLADSTTSGPNAGILGRAGFEGPARMGFFSEQFNVGQGAFESPIVQSYAAFGIGDRALTPDPVTLQLTPNVAFTGPVARFRDLDPAGVTLDFNSVTINWGDGTPLDNASPTHDSAMPGPTNFAVNGTHTYAREGTYTIIVKAIGNKGAIGTARSVAVVSSASIVAVGEKLDIKGPSVANRILATFTDSTSPGRPGNYVATVDWGDGTVARGVIAKAGSRFTVRGSHVYKDAEPFSVLVRIHQVGAAESTDAFAWTTVTTGGFTPAPHLPPFPAVHLVGAWNGGPMKSLLNKVTGSGLDPAKLLVNLGGTFTVVNSGSLVSTPSKIRFFLSANTTVETADTQLLVNGLPEINVAAFTSGTGGTGSFNIGLPAGQSGAGKYLLTQLVYADPIMDFSKIDKVILTGPIDPILLIYDPVSELGQAPTGEFYTSEDGTKVTLKIALDTPPSASVTFPLESSVTAEGTVSPASLTFTPANWNTGQLVTVTGVDDGNVHDGTKAYKVTIKTPTTTDANYLGLPPVDIKFLNKSNE